MSKQNRQNESLLSHEELLRLVHYDPSTGQFTRLVKTSNVKVGDVAGFVRPDGYSCINIRRKRYLAHRLAWFYVHGVWPNNTIDHIDKNPSNNRIDNLRDVTHQVNHTNKSRYSRNSSGTTGVWWSKHIQKWQARLEVRGNKLYLGVFTNIEDAIAARKAAELSHNFTND